MPHLEPHVVALGWSPRVPGGQRGAEPPACAETEPGAGLREAGPDGGKGALSRRVFDARRDWIQWLP